MLKDFNKAISAKPKVKALWETLTPIARRDFLSWIQGAKQPKTHERRIRVTCSKILFGKRRPCCYALTPMNLYRSLSINTKAKTFWRTLTSDERRDFVDWIEKTKDSDEKALRIDKVCKMLAVGKRRP